MYVANGTTLPGLVNNTTYYAIRINENAFKVASTRANALANIATAFITADVNSIAYQDVHTFSYLSILGETQGTGLVTCSNASTIVYGSNVNFLAYFKKGDKFKIVRPPATSTTYIVTAAANPNLTVNTSTGITNGIALRYLGTTLPGVLTTSNIYYARNVSSTQITLFASYTNANANTSPLDATGLTVPCSLETLPISSQGVFESSISQVNNGSTLTLTSANTTGAHLINKSYLLPSGMYPFSDSYVHHRAHDGGVEIIPSNNTNAQIIRQTRKYFRYQPGKGIQCSLSVNFNAAIEIDYLSRSGTTATARTRKPHRLSSGLSIQISGANQSQWNGTYVLTSITVNTFTFTLTSTPTETVATDQFWHYFAKQCFCTLDMCFQCMLMLMMS